jgi:hypothetical protein
MATSSFTFSMAWRARGRCCKGVRPANQSERSYSGLTVLRCPLWVKTPISSTALAAIMAADVVGYSQSMQADEAGTLPALSSIREATEKQINEHRDRMVNTASDFGPSQSIVCRKTGRGYRAQATLSLARLCGRWSLTSFLDFWEG